MTALLIYGLGAAAILFVVVRWIRKPIGGWPRRGEPQSSSDPAKPGVAWRDEKRID
jgi:hypothetical protein